MSHEFYQKKVTFSISIDVQTLFNLRELQQMEYRNLKFSQFIQQMLRLGVAKAKELQSRTIQDNLRPESDSIPSREPRSETKSIPRRIVTKKKK